MSNEQRIPSECLGAIGKSRISQGKTGLQNTSVSSWETVPGSDKTPTRLSHSSMRHKTIEYSGIGQNSNKTQPLQYETQDNRILPAYIFPLLILLLNELLVAAI